MISRASKEITESVGNEAASNSEFADLSQYEQNIFDRRINLETLALGSAASVNIFLAGNEP